MVRDEEKSQARGFYRVSLRLPIELHAELERRSAAEDRSLHAEIIHGLRTYTGQGALVRRRRGVRPEEAGGARREAGDGLGQHS